MEHGGLDTGLRRPARGLGANRAHGGAAGGTAQCALACGLRRDTAAAAPGRGAARPHPGRAQAGPGTGRRHRGADRRRYRAHVGRAGPAAELRHAGGGAAARRAPAVGTGRPHAHAPAGAARAHAGHRRGGAGRECAAPVAHGAARTGRGNPGRLAAGGGALCMGGGGQRRHHAAGGPAAALAGPGQHRDAVPAGHGWRGAAARPWASGAGRSAQRGRLRFLFRAAAPVVPGQRRAVPGDLRGDAGRRPADRSTDGRSAFPGPYRVQSRAARAVPVRAHARVVGRAARNAGDRAGTGRGAAHFWRPGAGAGDRPARPAGVARAAPARVRRQRRRLVFPQPAKRRPGNLHAGRAELALRTAAGADARARRAGTGTGAVALAADPRADAAARHAGAADRHCAGTRALCRDRTERRGRDGIGAAAQRAARRHFARRTNASDGTDRAGRVAAAFAAGPQRAAGRQRARAGRAGT